MLFIDAIHIDDDKQSCSQQKILFYIPATSAPLESVFTQMDYPCSHTVHAWRGQQAIKWTGDVNPLTPSAVVPHGYSYKASYARPG